MIGIRNFSLLATKSPIGFLSRQATIFRQTIKQQGRFLSSRNALKPSVPHRSPAKSQKLSLLFGASCSIAMMLNMRSPILSNAIGYKQPEVKVPIPQVRTSRFGGKLDYGDLTFGSITGLFLGVVVGKLSSVLAVLFISVYLFTQFLEDRGVISINWKRYLYLTKDSVDLREFLFEKPSFKLSFIATFAIAAFNI